MKSLNQTYVKFINKKYKRRGHPLADRFNSKIIDTNEYLHTVSAYVHNNAKDLPEYNGKEFEYPYSSMGIYMGKHKDKRDLGCVNESDKSKAIRAYTKMVIEKRDVGINRKLREYLDAFKKEQYEYKSYREVILRDKKPEEVIKTIAKEFGINDITELNHRWKRNTMEFRQVVAYTLTVYCGLKIVEVCKYMHNITASCCGKLVNRGFELFSKKSEIKLILIGN
jgi:putative transposase